MRESTQDPLAGPDPLVGRVLIEKYEIQLLLGRGPVADVYKARDISVDRLVAVEFLHINTLHDPLVLKRFQEEAKAAKLLLHPNVVTVHDFGVTPDTGIPYLVLDYLNGQKVSSMIKQEHQLTPERCIDLMLQACSGLSHAHSHGIIHRDIRPGSLFVTVAEDGTELLKVLDFGIAKILNPDGVDTTLRMAKLSQAAVAYISPEQCNGKTPDARSDIYSLGCVVYECLMGAPPFSGTTMSVLMKQVREIPPPFATVRSDLSVPTALEEVVFKALAKNPEDRFTTMSDVSSALAQSSPAGAVQIVAITTIETPREDAEPTVSKPLKQGKSGTSGKQKEIKSEASRKKGRRKKGESHNAETIDTTAVISDATAGDAISPKSEAASDDSGIAEEKAVPDASNEARIEEVAPTPIEKLDAGKGDSIVSTGTTEKEAPEPPEVSPELATSEISNESISAKRPSLPDVIAPGWDLLSGEFVPIAIGDEHSPADREALTPRELPSTINDSFDLSGGFPVLPARDESGPGKLEVEAERSSAYTEAPVLSPRTRPSMMHDSFDLSGNYPIFEIGDEDSPSQDVPMTPTVAPKALDIVSEQKQDDFASLWQGAVLRPPRSPEIIMDSFDLSGNYPIMEVDVDDQLPEEIAIGDKSDRDEAASRDSTSEGGGGLIVGKLKEPSVISFRKADSDRPTSQPKTNSDKASPENVPPRDDTKLEKFMPPVVDAPVTALTVEKSDTEKPSSIDSEPEKLMPAVVEAPATAAVTGEKSDAGAPSTETASDTGGKVSEPPKPKSLQPLMIAAAIASLIAVGFVIVNHGLPNMRQVAQADSPQVSMADPNSKTQPTGDKTSVPANEKTDLPHTRSGVTPTSDESKTRGAGLVETAPKKVVMSGKNTAILVATTKYDNKSFPELSNPTSDAHSIQTILKDYYGWNTILLENRPKLEIMRAIKKYVNQKHSPEDQLFIYFAGHGDWDNSLNDGMIVTTDSKADDEDKETYIKYAGLKTLLDRGHCKKILLALDVCFGGTFLDQIGKSRGGGTDIYDQASLNECLERCKDKTVRRLVTPGGKETVFEGKAGAHSPLANNLIKTLIDRGDNRGFVRFIDVERAASLTKPMGRAGDFSDMDNPEGDFLFVPVAGSPAPPAATPSAAAPAPATTTTTTTTTQ